MKPATQNHTVLDGATRVVHNKPKQVKQPAQRQTRQFAAAGRQGCTSCGKR